jgi:hypothetical protein
MTNVNRKQNLGAPEPGREQEINTDVLRHKRSQYLARDLGLECGRQARTSNNYPTMDPKLPPIIETYVEASNRHDVDGIVSCFSNDAVVHDENQDHRGTRAIEEWIRSTIEKYQFQFRPLSAEGDEGAITVVTEVLGNFNGSPITLDYNFEIDGNKIISLSID